MQTHVLPRPPRRHEINWKRIALVAGIAVLLAIGAKVAMRSGHIAAPAAPTAAELEDKRIAGEVDRVLDSSSALRRQDIGIKVQNGVVFLNGRVQSKEESDIAENLTYSVVGVNGIKNNLQVGDAKRPVTKPAALPVGQKPAPQSTQTETQPAATTPVATNPPADAAAQQRRINQLLNQAQRQSDAGHWVLARDLYLAVLAMDPNNAQADEGRKYVHRMLVQRNRNNAR